LECYLW